jgi:hypothetical protein
MRKQGAMAELSSWFYCLLLNLQQFILFSCFKIIPGSGSNQNNRPQTSCSHVDMYLTTVLWLGLFIKQYCLIEHSMMHSLIW